jgi:hypothetical protein
LRVPDVEEAKAKLEAAGAQINEMSDFGVCHRAGFLDPDGNAILLHHRRATRYTRSGSRLHLVLSSSLPARQSP